MSRPSASVFSTSMVLPLRAVSTSPSFTAEPLGMFSTSASTPSTFTFNFWAAMACTPPSTAAAPAMSPFMSTMPSVGFSDSPPLSKVTPLPTSASVGPPGLPV